MFEIAKGDKQSYELLFEEFYTSLCVFAENYLKSPELAMDVVQNVFLKIWERRKDFSHVSDVKSYLYVTVRNTCLNEINKNKKNKIEQETLIVDLLKTQSFYKDSFIEEETYRLLRNAIDNLPEQTRKIMYMAMEGLKNPVIAEELGISKHTVHTLKKRAYKLLRGRLRDYFMLLLYFF